MSVITLRDVSRWYGNVVAVNDVSFEVGPGITGLLGPNGAGKTTLLHMMAGFLAPSAGTVDLDGTPTWRHPQVYRTIGFVPEREAVYGFITARQFMDASAARRCIHRSRAVLVKSRGPICGRWPRRSPAGRSLALPAWVVNVRAG